MSTSPQYKVLESRLLQLESNLLPQIDPTILKYTDRDQDLIKAFCLLCHAEIETYLEKVVLDIATAAYNNWKNNKAIISPIIFCLACNHKQKLDKKKDSPYEMVEKSFKNLEASINANHGIKAENIDKILTPIGFSMDETLKLTLDNFGKNRGKIAHTSFQTQHPLDPVTQKKDIHQIKRGLEDFDKELFKYGQSVNAAQNPITIQWWSYIIKLIRKIVNYRK